MRFAILLTLALSACNTRPPLPILGSVPDFELTAQNGQKFLGSSLRGHVWVADFIFTNCPGPCLRMSTLLGRVQTATESFPDVRLVSFTVDPARDTPAALLQFAAKYHANANRWSFLTGPQPTLQMLSRDAFKLGDVDGTLNHQTRFVLVDRKGQIRGYYRTDEADPVAKVAADARRLRNERE
jgi:protein SCO1/2